MITRSWREIVSVAFWLCCGLPFRLLAYLSRLAPRGPIKNPFANDKQFGNGTVDVIVPSYLSCESLERLMDCFEGQTLSHDRFRLIIILNGPDDGSERMLRSRCWRTRFVIRSSAVANAGAARNVGLSAVDADFVTFVDADDEVSREYLEALLRVSSPETIAVAKMLDDGVEGANARRFDALGNGTWRLTQQSWILSYTCGKLFPAKTVASHFFDDSLRSGEDVIFMAGLLRFSELRLTAAPKAVYRRTLREASVSRQKLTKDFVVNQRLQVIAKLLRLKTPPRAWFALNERVAAQFSMIRF